MEIPPTVVGGFLLVVSTEHVLGRAVIPTHGSGWIFKSLLRKDLNDPPTAVGGIQRFVISTFE